MSMEPILPVKVPVTIDTMVNFDRDVHGDGDGVGMCKLTFTLTFSIVPMKRFASDNTVFKFDVDASANAQCERSISFIPNNHRIAN